MFLNINYVLVSRHVFFSCFVVYVVCRLHKITLDPLVFILYTSTEYEMWCHKTCDYIFFLQNMYQIETKCGAQKNNRKQYWFWFTKIIFIVNTPMSDQIVVHTHTHAYQMASARGNSEYLTRTPLRTSSDLHPPQSTDEPEENVVSIHRVKTWAMRVHYHLVCHVLMAKL